MRPGFKPNDTGGSSQPRHRQRRRDGRNGQSTAECHRLLVVDFRRTALTLRVPAHPGAIRIAQAELEGNHAAALAACRPAGRLPGHWSRWATVYVAKLNSGKPELLAEILRDLTPLGGSWKAKLYDEASIAWPRNWRSSRISSSPKPSADQIADRGEPAETELGRAVNRAIPCFSRPRRALARPAGPRPRLQKQQKSLCWLRQTRFGSAAPRSC